MSALDRDKVYNVVFDVTMPHGAAHRCKLLIGGIHDTDDLAVLVLLEAQGRRALYTLIPEVAISLCAGCTVRIDEFNEAPQ